MFDLKIKQKIRIVSYERGEYLIQKKILIWPFSWLPFDGHRYNSLEQAKETIASYEAKNKEPVVLFSTEI